MAKKQGGGLGTGARPEGEEYYFGTAEEKHNRVATGYGEKDPASNAPHFTQIPTSNTGKNINEPAIENKSGHMKFSKGV